MVRAPKGGGQQAAKRAPKGRGKGQARKPAKPAPPAQRKMKKQGGGKTKSGGGGNPLHFGSNALVPTAFRTGNAYPIKGVVRNSMALGITAGEKALIAVTNNGIAGTVMHIVRFNTATVLDRIANTIPLLALADDAGGPTSGRAMKGGVHVTNTTQFLNLGGTVFNLSGSARIRLPAAPSTLTGLQWIDVWSALVGHPDTVRASGEAFHGPGREFICHVVDHKRYEDFEEWKGSQTTDEFWAHIAIWPGLTPNDRPMSTSWVLWDTPPVAQTYALDAHADYYTRWSVDTVVGQNMVPIPVAAPKTVNDILLAGEKAGRR